MTFRIPVWFAAGVLILIVAGCAIAVGFVRSAADVEPVRRVVVFK